MNSGCQRDSLGSQETGRCIVVFREHILDAASTGSSILGTTVTAVSKHISVEASEVVSLSFLAACFQKSSNFLKYFYCLQRATLGIYLWTFCSQFFLVVLILLVVLRICELMFFAGVQLPLVIVLSCHFILYFTCLFIFNLSEWLMVVCDFRKETTLTLAEQLGFLHIKISL